VSIESVPCVVRGRPHDLEMIFGNLLDNAAKYGGTPPQTVICIQPRGQTRVTIRISDNGSGVPSDMRRKIFLRFLRGGSELERRTKGTGLGLYLVKELVSKLRGRIQVHGRGPLSGATFEMELPGRPGELVAPPAPDLPV
jgi:two-component system phosphate regulon sensor histidine kinase PhoR